jgi:hypothetical protein
MFPGLVLGCIGVIQIFLTSNIAIIASAPHSQSGIVGAVSNAANQLGAAVGAAAITSIQQNIDRKQPDPQTTYKGRQAGFWFMVAVVIVEMVAFIIFYQTPSAGSIMSPTETLHEEEGQSDSKVNNSEYSISEDIEKQLEIKLSFKASSKEPDAASVLTTLSDDTDYWRRMSRGLTQ